MPIGGSTWPRHSRKVVEMNMERNIRVTEVPVRMAAHYGEMHRLRSRTKRRLLARRAAAYVAAALVGATLALAIHDAPTRIAATVLDAQRPEGW